MKRHSNKVANAKYGFEYDDVTGRYTTFDTEEQYLKYKKKRIEELCGIELDDGSILSKFFYEPYTNTPIPKTGKEADLLFRKSELKRDNAKKDAVKMKAAGPSSAWNENSVETEIVGASTGKAHIAPPCKCDQNGTKVDTVSNGSPTDSNVKADEMQSNRPVNANCRKKSISRQPKKHKITFLNMRPPWRGYPFLDSHGTLTRPIMTDADFREISQPSHSNTADCSVHNNPIATSPYDKSNVNAGSVATEFLLDVDEGCSNNENSESDRISVDGSECTFPGRTDAFCVNSNEPDYRDTCTIVTGSMSVVGPSICSTTSNDLPIKGTGNQRGNQVKAENGGNANEAVQSKSILERSYDAHPHHQKPNLKAKKKTTVSFMNMEPPWRGYPFVDQNGKAERNAKAEISTLVNIDNNFAHSVHDIHNVRPAVKDVWDDIDDNLFLEVSLPSLDAKHHSTSTDVPAEVNVVDNRDQVESALPITDVMNIRNDQVTLQHTMEKGSMTAELGQRCDIGHHFVDENVAFTFVE